MTGTDEVHAAETHHATRYTVRRHRRCREAAPRLSRAPDSPRHPPINHTIPLLRALKVNTWTFVLLPEATPLDDRFKYRMIHDNAVDFSRQLIEGVAFLHSQGIAHLDIKPQNIVVVPNKLFIIDFDISVRVDGPSTHQRSINVDALIDRWCGTPGWMAPEIGHQDGPKYWYSYHILYQHSACLTLRLQTSSLYHSHSLHHRSWRSCYVELSWPHQ